jgi:hypothetical protein
MSNVVYLYGQPTPVARFLRVSEHQTRTSARIRPAPVQSLCNRGGLVQGTTGLDHRPKTERA